MSTAFLALRAGSAVTVNQLGSGADTPQHPNVHGALKHQWLSCALDYGNSA